MAKSGNLVRNATVFAVTLFTSTSAVGQSSNSSGGDILDNIEITGTRSQALTSATPADARAAVNRITGAATILDLEDAEGQRNATLADVLRLAPGVFAAPRFGQEDLRLSIRGSGIVRTGHGKGVLLIRDSVPVNAADGNFDAPTLDLHAGSYLGILRSSAAIGVGATTLGGAILLESRTGRNNPGVSAAFDGGSFGTFRGAGAAGAAGEIVDGFVSFTRSATDGYRLQSASDALRFSGNIGWRVTPHLETRVFGGHAEIDSKWPGALTRAEFEANPRQAALISVQRDQDNNIRQSFLSSRTTYVTGVHQFTIALGLDDRFKDHATPGGILFEENEGLGGSLVYELSQPGDRLAKPLSLGIRTTKTDQQAETYGYGGAPTSPQAAARGTLTASRDRRALSNELFGRGELTLTGDLFATASLAAVWTDRRDRSGQGDPVNAPPSYDISFSDVLPGAGLLWQPRSDAMVFAGWSQSFEAPSFFDLGGNVPLQADRQPRLTAQTADSIEIGTRGRHNGFRWDVTLFHSRISGELLRLDAAAALNPPIVNANRTRRTGLEAAVKFDLAGLIGGQEDVHTVSAKWDWLDARFHSDPVYGDARVAGVPEHSAYIELEVQPVKGFTVRPNLTIRSKTQTDFLNTPGHAAEGFMLAGLSLRYELGKAAVWLDARNLGDRRYVSAVNVVNRSTATSGLFFPGDGRSVFGGITLKL